MSESLVPLTGFQRDLLVVIAGGTNQSGQEIKEELDDDMSTEINHGRLYPNLDVLVKVGLVEKGTIDRRTHSYNITEAGREALGNRREWEH